ncbi:MAG: uracil-DNA glycosylase [Acidobacteria bacterium]|nr:uracil-DNA glycosylase [Acidobacteriota bacterium]
MADALPLLRQDIISCERCPRLRLHCAEVARTRRRAYLDWDYWGRPVPGFGDPQASLFVLGLAPGAHGANRTGRVFTGDRSGDWLYRAMHQAGFANQPTSVSATDGLRLRNAWVSAAVRCAPPDNKPTPAEFECCMPYLERELALLRRVKVVLALGRLACSAYLSVLRGRGVALRLAEFPFAHGAQFLPVPGGPHLLCSYHPSQQNTLTRRLTDEMLLSVFRRAAQICAET